MDFRISSHFSSLVIVRNDAKKQHRRQNKDDDRSKKGASDGEDEVDFFNESGDDARDDDDDEGLENQHWERQLGLVSLEDEVVDAFSHRDFENGENAEEVNKQQKTRDIRQGVVLSVRIENVSVAVSERFVAESKQSEDHHGEIRDDDDDVGPSHDFHHFRGRSSFQFSVEGGSSVLDGEGERRDGDKLEEAEVDEERFEIGGNGGGLFRCRVGAVEEADHDDDDCEVNCEQSENGDDEKFRERAAAAHDEEAKSADEHPA